jgi:hypothetical protein
MEKREERAATGVWLSMIDLKSGIVVGAGVVYR